jgi:hypothetical protein
MYGHGESQDFARRPSTSDGSDSSPGLMPLAAGRAGRSQKPQQGPGRQGLCTGDYKRTERCPFYFDNGVWRKKGRCPKQKAKKKRFTQGETLSLIIY